MKRFLNYVSCVYLLIFVLNFSSCQKEHVTPIDSQAEETLKLSSLTTKLIKDTSSKDGSYDNIVDGSSCFGIQFPYTVRVNNFLSINITEKEDLNKIEKVFDTIQTDVDVLEITFPITVTLVDYSEITVNDLAGLNNLKKQCTEGGNDDDIECIDFIYPISISTFDINALQTGNVVMNKDRELRRFFAGLDENDLVSIVYPISMKKYDGTEIPVNSNEELKAVIESARFSCDEDDDNDYGDDDFNQEQLTNLLVKCPWIVKLVERNGANNTLEYSDYLMNFSANGSVTTKNRAGQNLEGSWSVKTSDNYETLLVLSFEELADFSMEWKVSSVANNIIVLAGGSNDKIHMQKSCGILTNSTTAMIDILRECSWLIEQIDTDNVEVKRLLGYDLDFLPQGQVILNGGGDNISTGTWEIKTSAQGRLVLSIDRTAQSDVNSEWLIVGEVKNNYLIFEISSTGQKLKLQRRCPGESGDSYQVEGNWADNGTWKIMKNADINVVDEKYQDFDFSFLVSPNVKAVRSGYTDINGIWGVAANGDKTKVYLNFGDEGLLKDLTEHYEVLGYSEEIISLVTVSENGDIIGGISKILTFKKVL